MDDRRHDSSDRLTRRRPLRCGLLAIAALASQLATVRADEPSRVGGMTARHAVTPAKGPAAAPAALARAVARDRGLVLCIGINEYRDRPKLRRAEGDALAVARELQRLRFRVVLLMDRDVTLASVRAALGREPVAVFYAGHAQGKGLVLRDGMLPLTEVARHTDVILLDGCAAGNDLRVRGATRLYAAARDYAFEAGDHGLFTKHLLAWLRAGNLLGAPGMADYLAKNIALETGGWQQAVYGYLPATM